MCVPFKMYTFLAIMIFMMFLTELLCESVVMIHKLNFITFLLDPEIDLLRHELPK